MRKQTICICDPDQLHGNREADHHLCFRYTDSTHTGKCKSTGAGCNELVQSKLRTGVRLKWRKR